jgi:hypothetical protein
MSTRALDSESEFTVGAVPDESVAENPRQGPPSGRSSKTTVILCGVLAAIAIAAACYWLWPRSVATSPPAAPGPEATSSSPAQPTEPAIQHPVEQIPSTAAAAETPAAQFPLPGLDSSDAVAKDAIGAILGSDAFARILVPDGLVRRIVATVDSMTSATIAQRILPVAPVPGMFVTATDHGLAFGTDNASRYKVYVEAAEAIDTARLAGFYVRLYPLFQQAYGELGYPHGYFNDRLVYVIDHLLAAPEPKPPVVLSQPKVMYEFADPALEQLSAGQKMLVRVGLDNELRLKAKLREIRKAVTGKAKPS